jgi:hypothetical protein
MAGSLEESQESMILGRWTSLTDEEVEVEL